MFFHGRLIFEYLKRFVFASQSYSNLDNKKTFCLKKLIWDKNNVLEC